MGNSFTIEKIKTEMGPFLIKVDRLENGYYRATVLDEDIKLEVTAYTKEMAEMLMKSSIELNFHFWLLSELAEVFYLEK